MTTKLYKSVQNLVLRVTEKANGVYTFELKSKDSLKVYTFEAVDVTPTTSFVTFVLNFTELPYGEYNYKVITSEDVVCRFGIAYVFEQRMARPTIDLPSDKIIFTDEQPVPPPPILERIQII